MEFAARVLYDFEAVGEDELSLKAEEVVTITSTAVGEGWWMGRNTEGREGILPEAYVERLEVAGEEEARRASVATSWGDDWDSEEEHKYEDPQDLLAPDPAPVYSLPTTSRPFSAPTESHVGTSSRKPTIPPPPAVERREEGKKKFSYVPAVFKQSNQVNEYLSGVTEASATLAKEAVLVNELNKVRQTADCRVKTFLTKPRLGILPMGAVRRGLHLQDWRPIEGGEVRWNEILRALSHHSHPQ